MDAELPVEGWGAPWLVVLQEGREDAGVVSLAENFLVGEFALFALSRPPPPPRTKLQVLSIHGGIFRGE